MQFGHLLFVWKFLYQSLGSSVFVSGCFAFACSWIGIFCYVVAMKQNEAPFPKWFPLHRFGPGFLPFSASPH